MPRLPSSHGVRGAAAHAADHYARQRRAERFDPSAGLFVTHRFGSGAFIDDAAVFPAATVPLTFAVDVQAAGPLINGVVFEIGGDSFGTVFAFDATNGFVVLASGVGRSLPEGATAQWSGFDFAKGSFAGVHRFVGAVNPGRGVVNLWHNGKLVGAAVAPSGSFNLHDGKGGRVEGIEDQYNNRITGDAAVGLADAALVGPVRFFYRQLPRAMQNAGLGADAGDGAWSN